MEIRNIAIIAHVDHGKTTLVDAILRQSGTFRDNEKLQERVMDSLDQERERGITIESKNACFYYKNTKFNLIDTPGHSDFGGEVERVLSMVDGVCLLVDAAEGPLPQTRFVLKKALQKKLLPLVIINKIDRKDARVQEVENAIFDLFIELDATEEQLAYKILFAAASYGVAYNVLEDARDFKGDLRPLFDALTELIPFVKKDKTAPFAMVLSNIMYSDFLGKMGVGRVEQGCIKANQQALLVSKKEKKKIRIQSLHQFDGLKKKQVEQVEAGDIAILSGAPDLAIGDTVTDVEQPTVLPRIEVDPPTVCVTFHVNTSPMAGRDGKVLLSRELRERLLKESLRNVSIRIEETDTADAYRVYGRGELQFSVIIEKIRREGLELAIGKPQAVIKREKGILLEPMEEIFIDVPDAYVGTVSEILYARKGQMTNMVKKESGRTYLTFKIPSRGLIGFRVGFLTKTRGTGVLNSLFAGYETHKGTIPARINGALVADRSGKSVAYSLYHLEARGKLFIGPNTEVYPGMIIGENRRSENLRVNVLKGKKLSNTRSVNKDDMIQLSPYTKMSLEQSMEWINEDELVEATPRYIRIRKKQLK